MGAWGLRQKACPSLGASGHSKFHCPYENQHGASVLTGEIVRISKTQTHKCIINNGTKSRMSHVHLWSVAVIPGSQ